jgi:hypothetical protein
MEWAISDSETYRGTAAELIGCAPSRSPEGTLMAKSLSPRRMAWAALLAVPTLVAACGARGPLDIVVVEGQEADAGAGVDAAATVDASEVAPEASPPEAGGPPGFDAGGLINCGTCLYESCGAQVLACITSNTCLTTAQCAVTMCFAGGMPDPLCILQKCANGDPQALSSLIGVFTCVAVTCGMQCTSVLGGLLGGGGVPGGGGGGSGG